MDNSNQRPRIGRYPTKKASRKDEMAAFDSLPKKVRDLSNYSILPLHSASLQEAIERGINVVYLINFSEETFVRNVANQYRAETGHEYPHIAARATVLR